MDTTTAPKTSEVEVVFVKTGAYSGIWFKSHQDLEDFMSAAKRKSEEGADFSWLHGMRLRVVTRQNWNLMQKLMADPQVLVKMNQPAEALLPPEEMTTQGEALRQAYAERFDVA